MQCFSKFAFLTRTKVDAGYTVRKCSFHRLSYQINFLYFFNIHVEHINDLICCTLRIRLSTRVGISSFIQNTTIHFPNFLKEFQFNTSESNSIMCIVGQSKRHCSVHGFKLWN